MKGTFGQVLLPKPYCVEVGQVRYFKHRDQVLFWLTFDRLVVCCHDQISSDLVVCSLNIERVVGLSFKLEVKTESQFVAVIILVENEQVFENLLVFLFLQ